MKADHYNVSQINQKKIYNLCLLFFFFFFGGVAKKYSNFNSCIYAHINKFQICYHQFLPDE